MALNLTITSYQRLSPGQNRSKALEQGRLTLGRAPDNDWVLSDPEMVLSKNHCYIDYREDGYYITDTSTNGVFINHSEQRLGRGNSVKISDQDVLILGDYEISADLTGRSANEQPNESGFAGMAGMNEPISPEWPDQDSLSVPAKPTAPSAFSADSNNHAVAAIGDDIALPESLSDDDPLGLGGAPEDGQDPSWGQYSEPDHLPSDREFFQPPKAIPDTSNARTQQDNPLDSNQLDSLGLPIAPPTKQPAATASAIPDDWEDSLIQRLIKEEDSPQAAAMPTESPQAELAQPEDLLSENPLSEPPGPALEQNTEDTPAERPLDPFADLEESAQPGNFTERIPVQDAGLESSPEISSAEQEQARAQPPQTAVPVAAEPPAPSAAKPTQSPAGAGYAQAAQALLQGAGMPGVKLGEAEALALLQRMGKIFRCTSQGMMELLRARGNVKYEFNMERTLVGPVENNPLKILPNVDEAMNAMLLRQDQTWTPADRAISEGFTDLRAHELAFMAGMQAALKHLLATFDPEQLEQELGQHSAWSNLLAGGRKARHWDAFTALYSKIASRAEDDFQDLFRKEFARAYQTQLQQLSTQRKS